MAGTIVPNPAARAARACRVAAGRRPALRPRDRQERSLVARAANQPERAVSDVGDIGDAPAGDGLVDVLQEEDEDSGEDELDDVQEQRAMREQKIQYENEQRGGGGRGGGRDGEDRGGGGRGGKGGRKDDGWEDKIIELNRVTKVLKGGKLMKFRAVVVSGNRKGEIGYGVASAREVVEAVERAAGLAKLNSIEVPVTPGLTFPHKIQVKEGAARIMLRPASEGTGVIAGGAVRIVLELAGYQNAFGKIYGTDSAMNNTRGTIAALSQMFTWRGISQTRGVTIDYAMGRVSEPDEIYKKPPAP